jgi:dolichol-phosphate mannosyltransferase
VRDAVVLPVYNERSTVACVLDAVRRVFDDLVIVVDDGSTDGTGEHLASRRDIVTLCNGENRGYGASLMEGLHLAALAGAERIVTMDCDGQHEPAHIPAFLAALDDADIVSGSRYLAGSAVVGTAPADRRAVNARVTETINAATGWTLTDAFCGFKAYRADVVTRLDIREPGYAMPLELWARAWQAGLRVIELPVERIYFDNDRSFGEDLDDTEKRYAYYRRVWRCALGEEER